MECPSGGMGVRLMPIFSYCPCKLPWLYLAATAQCRRTAGRSACYPQPLILIRTDTSRQFSTHLQCGIHQHHAGLVDTKECECGQGVDMHSITSSSVQDLIIFVVSH